MQGRGNTGQDENNARAEVGCNHCLLFFVSGFIFMYLLYVSVVIFGRLIYQKWKRKRSVRTGDIPSEIVSLVIIVMIQKLFKNLCTGPLEKQKGEEMSGSVRQKPVWPSNGDISVHSNGVAKQHVTIGRHEEIEDQLTHSGEVMDPSLIKIIDSEVEKKVEDKQTTEKKVEDKQTIVTVEVQPTTVQYSTVQYSTAQYSTVQYMYSTAQYSTVQYMYSTVQYSTVHVQYSTVQYSTAQYMYSIGVIIVYFRLLIYGMGL